MDLECPYCNAEQNVNHDDGYTYTEGVKHEMQCCSCEKYFVYQTSISFYYEPEKADCLNDTEHDFQPTITYPKEFTKMECTMCGENRTPTPEEMMDILNDTFKL
jgi:hypothetical protein